MVQIDFKFNLSSLKEIAAGGEGRILEHPTNKSLVIKYYHTPKDISYIKHLENLSVLNDCFLKPINSYIKSGKLVGFDMKYVNFSNYFLFNNLFNKGFCQSNSIDYNFKVKVLKNLTKELQALHSLGIVIGDLNQYNLFFSKKAEILFVDVDSYQTKDNNHSGVLLDEIRDWLDPYISDKSDMWAFDILTFWSLTYCHPFKWVNPNDSDSLEIRVRKNKSYLNTSGIKIPKLYEPLNNTLVSQFEDVFKGRRFLVQFDNTVQKLTVQIPQTINSQSLNVREIDSNVQTIIGNSDYVAVQIGKEWYVLDCTLKGVTFKKDKKVCDVMYLGLNSNKAIVDQTLLLGEKKSYYLPNALYHYYDGYLTVIDQENDLMYNFDIYNQLGEINHTTTSVFAKSIILRDCLIQNFGTKKYILISIKDRSQLIDVDFTIKNANVSGDYYCIEYLENNLTKFKVVNWKTKSSFFIDHYAYISTLNGIVFIPDDEFIGVYKDSVLISKLDISICSKSSKIISTKSGLLLLENNKLYLLNTK